MTLDANTTAVLVTVAVCLTVLALAGICAVCSVLGQLAGTTAEQRELLEEFRRERAAALRGGPSP